MILPFIPAGPAWTGFVFSGNYRARLCRRIKDVPDEVLAAKVKLAGAVDCLGPAVSCETQR